MRCWCCGCCIPSNYTTLKLGVSISTSLLFVFAFSFCCCRCHLPLFCFMVIMVIFVLFHSFGSLFSLFFRQILIPIYSLLLLSLVLFLFIEWIPIFIKWLQVKWSRSKFHTHIQPMPEKSSEITIITHKKHTTKQTHNLNSNLRILCRFTWTRNYNECVCASLFLLLLYVCFLFGWTFSLDDVEATM